MERKWTADEVLAMARNYQTACVLAAAADLGLFNRLSAGPQSAEEVAGGLAADGRGTRILLDALSALGLLSKESGRYTVPVDLRALLVGDGPGSVSAMVRHQANCLRRWARLAAVVQSGKPADAGPSPHGAAGDLASFIGAMHDVSAPVAEQVIGSLVPPPFHRLLDVGGASGTWTAAFLRACPASTAILFDRPEVVPLARIRLGEAGLLPRVELAGGDFMLDPLPAGADLAWVSAIVHQNSREENRRLFAAVHRSLAPEGRIAIRDVIMEPTRTAPVAGALFAVNMLTATPGGDTYPLEELTEDLQSAGFREIACRRWDEGMNNVLVGVKAAGG